MKKIFGILSAAVMLAVPAVFSGCDDDNDSVTDNKEGTYAGQATVWYYAAGSDGRQELVSESFAAYVAATALGDDRMNFKVYRRSVFNNFWVVPGALGDIDATFTSNTTGAVGDNNVNIDGGLLTLKHDLLNPEQVEGRTYLKVKFEGLKSNETFRNMPFKDELNPVGVYKGTFSRTVFVAETDEDWAAGNFVPSPTGINWQQTVYAQVTYDASQKKLETQFFWDEELTASYLPAKSCMGNMPQTEYDKLVCGNETFTYDGKLSYDYFVKDKPYRDDYSFVGEKIR